MKRLTLVTLMMMVILPVYGSEAKSTPDDAYWFEGPYRELSIILTDDGYYPQRLNVFRGEKIRFYLANTGREDRCFMIQDKGIFTPVRKGEFKVVEVEFTHEEVLNFHCPVGNMRGKISVLEHPREIRQKRRMRELASESKTRAPKVWMPREQ